MAARIAGYQQEPVSEREFHTPRVDTQHHTGTDTLSGSTGLLPEPIRGPRGRNLFISGRPTAAAGYQPFWRGEPA
jgi:hypothetical protein